MKTFKEQYEKDLDVFFNLDEFAELHKIGNDEIPVVIIQNATRKREKLAAFMESDGRMFVGDINKSALLYQCRTKDLKAMPVARGRQLFDDQLLEVIEVSEKSGVTEVLLWGLGGVIK